MREALMKAKSIEEFSACITVEDMELDPYPIYARLREEAPVAFVPAINLTLVTKYRDVEYAGIHPEIFSAQVDGSPVDETFGAPTIITIDGDVHTELRRSLDAKYRPREVRSYIDELVNPICDELLDSLRGASTAELMSEYFEPVSVRSLAAVLGVDDLETDTLRDWFWRLHQGVINFEDNPERRDIGQQVSIEISEKLSSKFDLLEAEPNDSTISHMLHNGMPDGVCRGRDLVMPTLKVILLGGMQEPGHGSGSTMMGLLENPEQLDALVGDLDGLINQTVEEGLRWIAPIGSQTRQVTQPVTLGGVALEIGQAVAPMVSAANRDPEIFANPDDFDIFRVKSSNAAFGFGPHFCAGHAFSRSQMRIAISRLLDRYPNISMSATTPPVTRGWEFRAPRNLNVTLGTAR
jgi:cytochrome P450